MPVSAASSPEKVICSTASTNFRVRPSVTIRKRPVLDRDLEAAGGEGAGEHQAAGVLADVDEAAGAGEAWAELRDVDVAEAVGLGHAEAGHVEAAAVVEVELQALLQDGVGVQRRAEVEAALRHAADDAGLGGQRHMLEQALLGSDGGDALGHADAEVDDAAQGQLHRGAAGDDLAGVERQRRAGVERHPELAGEGVVVGRGVGLAVVLRLGDHDAVDERAGDQHALRGQRAGDGDALDLDDDDAVGVVRGHGGGGGVELQRLALHGGVAARVGGGGAQEGDVDREGAVEQPLLAVDLEEADDVLGGAFVDAAALLAGVDEGAQADLGQHAGLGAGDLAVELGDDAERQVVGLDAVLDRHPGELRHQRPVAADAALDQAVMGEAVEAAVAAIAWGGGEDQRQVAGVAGGEEALLQGDEEFVRGADADEAGDRDGVAIADDRHGLIWADDLSEHLTGDRSAT